MNVLIVNGAKRNGNTAKLAERIADGAREAGHSAETVQLIGKKISGWVECFGDDVSFEGTFGAWGMFEANVEETPAWGEAYEAGRKLS